MSVDHPTLGFVSAPSGLPKAEAKHGHVRVAHFGFFFFAGGNFFSHTTMKPKPPCPKCGDAVRVKTIGGGSKGCYRYACERPECNPCEWQQIPPHSQTAQEPVAIKMRSSTKPKRKTTQYLCGVCGQPKKGHACTGFRPAPVVAPVASAAMVQIEGDDADLADDAPLPPMALFAAVNHLPTPYIQVTRTNGDLSSS